MQNPIYFLIEFKFYYTSKSSIKTFCQIIYSLNCIIYGYIYKHNILFKIEFKFNFIFKPSIKLTTSYFLQMVD